MMTPTLYKSVTFQNEDAVLGSSDLWHDLRPGDIVLIPFGVDHSKFRIEGPRSIAGYPARKLDDDDTPRFFYIIDREKLNRACLLKRVERPIRVLKLRHPGRIRREDLLLAIAVLAVGLVVSVLKFRADLGR